MKLNNIFLFACLILLSCAADPKEEITEALHKYDNLLLKMNADSIAGIYAVDGTMGTIVGRDSIRNFLATFVDVKMMEQKSTSDLITMQGDTAIQTGSYIQKVIVKSDTLILKGQYSATWIKQDKKWYIQTMTTQPDEDGKIK